MTVEWQSIETTVHQDHVIAHVIGATVAGYFVFEEALYTLLDIGFVWTIFLDGEMGLLPHPVAINELDIGVETKDKIKADIERLLGNNPEEAPLEYLIRPPIECQINEVTFFTLDDRRRLILTGDEGTLVIETSLANGEIQINEL